MTLKLYQQKLQSLDQRLWVIMLTIIGALIFVWLYSCSISQQIKAAEQQQSLLEVRHSELIAKNQQDSNHFQQSKGLDMNEINPFDELVAEIGYLGLELKSFNRNLKNKDQAFESFQMKIGAAKESVMVLLKRLLNNETFMVKRFVYKKGQDTVMEIIIHGDSLKKKPYQARYEKKQVDWLC